jgi:NAD/NADP transhydrogenase alpha subunit
MGAIVRGFDTRPAVREQVQSSTHATGRRDCAQTSYASTNNEDFTGGNLSSCSNLTSQEVRGFDTRPAVREQVQSLGAEFVEVDFQEDGAGQGSNQLRQHQ